MKLSSKIIQLIQLTISDNNKVEIDDKSILRSCPDFYTMNAYTFDIFIMHSIVMENTEEDGMYTTTCELLEIGPLNGPDINNLESIKAIIRDISSTPVIQEWWADFSTWEDFFGILRAGTELSMHSIVTKINNQLTLLENGVSYIDLIDDNGNITIQYDETFPTLSQGFEVKAKRKRLRRLKDIAAYNVAKFIVSENDIKTLNLPNSLQSLVSKFLDIYSGDYRTA